MATHPGPGSPDDVPPADLAVALEARLARIWGVVLRQSFRELSRTATSVLATLRDAGPRRITELAANEAVAQPTMTTLVTRLERDGVVRRDPDPSDGRAVQVAVTDDGVALLARMGDARAAVLGARLERLAPEERAALAGALSALDRLTADALE